MKKAKTPQKTAYETTLENQEMHYLGVLARPPEPTILYKPGDAVILGNLRDCRVEEVSDEGRKLLISYHDAGESYGKPFDNQRRLPVIASWLEVIPVGMPTDTQFAPPYGTEIRIDYMNQMVDSLLHTAYWRGLIDNPDYQRGYVWTDDDKRRLIASVFEHADIGKFIFLTDDTYKDHRLEVIDGKQRLRALMDFREGRLTYQGRTWFELSHNDRYAFGRLPVQTCELRKSRVKKSDVLKVFLLVNRAGVPQTEEHITRAKEMYKQALAEEAAAGRERS